MKKILLIVLIVILAGFSVAFLIISRITPKDRLYILNWDEYIDESLLEEFEDKYNCKVIMEIAESNEIMFSRIDTRSADYDIAFPSDYMISQMAKNDMLYELDFSKINATIFPESEEDESILVPKLLEVIDNDASDITDYFVPYFWGSLGIMYNTDIISEEDFEVKVAEYEAEGKNAWNILFDKELENLIGMYASSRDAIAGALMALGYSVNTVDDNHLKEAEALLKNMNYKAWATDDLKVGVPSGKYALALVYSGDYIDALYSCEDPQEANFKMYVPKDINNVFFDGMVIPKTSANTKLAYEFINFMIDTEPKDPEDEESMSVAYQNADAIGYCPTIQSVLEEFEACIEEYNELSDEEKEEADPNDYYVGVVDQDAYNPSDIIGGEVYKYLDIEKPGTYATYEDIYKRVKSDTNEDDVNVSAYILVGIVVFIAGIVVVKIIVDKKKKH